MIDAVWRNGGLLTHLIALLSKLGIKQLNHFNYLPVRRLFSSRVSLQSSIALEISEFTVSSNAVKCPGLHLLDSVSWLGQIQDGG